jgi:serralysin
MCTICAAQRPYSNSCDYAGLTDAAAYFESLEVDAAQDISTAYTIAVGDTFSGAISTSAERDWVAITLTAGQTYDIDVRGSGSGVGTLTDTIMAIYDDAGVYLDGNDDGGAGAESYLSFTATTTGTYYVMARGYQAKTGTYEIKVTGEAPPPPPPPQTPVAADLDTLADYLTTGYWIDSGSAPHRFDTAAGNDITVNIDALTAEGQQLARWAFDAWEAVADLDFVETSGAARITFDDANAGANAGFSYSGGFTISANVNIGTGWLATQGTQIGSYGFQTYLHEIGHALGLGHMGNYNGGATYGVDETFINDSWQMSVMSYFSQSENTEVTATRLEAATAMLADIAAIQDLYGAAGGGTLTTGRTTYGVGHDLGDSWLGQMFDAMNGTGPASVHDGGPVAMTLFDVSGYDILDFSTDTRDQTVDLAPEAISDIGGQIGNLLIARGTWIEEYRAGSGNDTVTGTVRNNTLLGNDGDDTLIGGGGRDTLNGGAGADVLDGGGGRDTASYADAVDGVRVNLVNAASNTGEAAGDSYSGIENLIGGIGRDYLAGNGRINEIEGGDGVDRLYGRNGNDVLTGGRGNDLLVGGGGNDRLTGGGGRDTFLFNTGADVITDFGTGPDRLKLNDALWGNAVLSNAQILDFATVVAGDTVFDFGGGATLTLEGYTDIAALEPDLWVF